jgi:hypothetical protein
MVLVADNYTGSVQDEATSIDGDAAPDDLENPQEKSDEEILAEAKAFIAEVEEAEADERTKALKDIKFSLGEQWDESIKSERLVDARPCLVINRVKGQIHQLTNDLRQNRPSIKVHPVDDNADPDIAKKLAGLIRTIEYNSNADVAYDTAGDSAIRSGRGYFRVISQYCDARSFDQELVIKRVPNRFSVFFDPSSKEPDGSDACRAAITEDLSPTAYKAAYPKSKLAVKGEWEAIGNSTPDWVKADSCRVAEYLYKEFKADELLLLSNGQMLLKSELGEQELPEGVQVVNSRPTQVPKVCWVKLNACEILEKTTFPGSGKYIPIIPVYGDEVDVDGKREISGIVRDAQDPQRIYNYMKSAEAEAIGLAPRAPYLVEENSIEGYENEWKNANRKNYAFLKFKAYSDDGRQLPPPQRNTFEPAIQAISMAAMGSADDLKSVNGLYDAAMGARSNETSGRAILARGNQAQTANFHFSDNMTRSIRHLGRILIDAIPSVYDAARTERIIGEEGDHSTVKLNQPTDEKNAQGLPKVYDFSIGKYDVSVDVGPSYTTKRQEAAASMADLTKAYPQLMQVAGDLLIKNLDWPGAAELAERIKKTIPPELHDDPNQKKQPIPPQVQAQMKQMSQMVEQLTKALHDAHDQLDKKKPEIESREKIEMAKIQAEIEIEMAKMGSKESITLLNHEIEVANQRLEAFMASLGAAQIPQPQEQPQFQESSAPPMDGVQDAGPEEEQPQGTGALPPGSPMEGQPIQ